MGEWIGLVLFCVIAVCFVTAFVLLVLALKNGEQLSIESHWGGLGGGLGGWRVSKPFVWSAGTIGLFCALVTVGLHLSTPRPTRNPAERYMATVLAGQKQGIQFSEVRVVNGQLRLSGQAPSQEILNAVWEQIKRENPRHDDVVVDIRVASK